MPIMAEMIKNPSTYLSDFSNSIKTRQETEKKAAA
jgi:hypothetical protein